MTFWMIFWVILAIYVIGWAGFSVTIARMLEDVLPSSDAFERATSVFLGMLLALIWPLVIPGGWVYKRVFARKDES